MAANTGVNARQGTVTIAGQTYTLTQSAPGACTYSVWPLTKAALAEGDTASATVTTGAGCAWTAISNHPWITVTSSQSTAGTKTVTMSVAANTATSQRTGTVTIAGQTFTVTQAAPAGCSYAISPTTRTSPATGESTSVSMSAPAGCTWTATSSAAWMTVTTGASGSGDGVVGLTIAQNTGTSPRTGTVSIGGQTFTLTQSAAADCTYTVTPLFGASVAAGETVNVNVTTAGTSCWWTAGSNTWWITVTSGASGTASGTVGLSVAANTGVNARQGTVTIAGQTYTLTQSAPGTCTYSVWPLTKAALAEGDTASATVTTGACCAWTAISNHPWITVTSSQSTAGTKTVTMSVAANTATSQRTGTVTIAGQTFTVTQAAPAGCSYAISPTTRTSPAAGESTSVAVTAAAGCTWSATSAASWIGITAGATGSGNGTVAMSVAANTATTQRTGTVTIAGQTFTVTQNAAPCSYAISPTTRTSPAAGESTSVSVTTTAGCTWAATSAASWIGVTAGATGSGNGTVAMSVAANTATTQRTGTVTIAGQTFTVTQNAAPCTYAISPTTRTSPAAGESTSVAVTAAAGCTWSATSAASWIGITAGATGSGDGTVTMSVAANPAASIRTGTVTIGGQPFTVTQNAAPCTYAISPTTRTSPAAGESTSVSMSAPAGCTWTATSSAAWMTVTTGASGSGDGVVGLTIAQNTVTSPRTGTVSIGGQTFTLTQSAAGGCTYTVTPLYRASVAAGETANVNVTTAGTSCAWTAASNTSWITVTSGASGTTNGTVWLSVAANTGANARQGTVTIAGQTYTLTQSAPGTCAYGVWPLTKGALAEGDTASATVTTGAGCAWTAISNHPWITVTSSPSTAGTKTVTMTIAPNPGATQRIGTVTIAGQTFTVTQAAPAGCIYTVSPLTKSAVAEGETTTATVTAATGCTWTAVSGAAWVSVTDGASGDGNGTVTMTIAANTTTSQRTGTVTIAGRAFTSPRSELAPAPTRSTRPPGRHRPRARARPSASRPAAAAPGARRAPRRGSWSTRARAAPAMAPSP